MDPQQAGRRADAAAPCCLSCASPPRSSSGARAPRPRRAAGARGRHPVRQRLAPAARPGRARPCRAARARVRRPRRKDLLAHLEPTRAMEAAVRCRRRLPRLLQERPQPLGRRLHRLPDASPRPQPGAGLPGRDGTSGGERGGSFPGSGAGSAAWGETSGRGGARLWTSLAERCTGVYPQPLLRRQ